MAECAVGGVEREILGLSCPSLYSARQEAAQGCLSLGDNYHQLNAAVAFPLEATGHEAWWATRVSGKSDLLVTKGSRLKALAAVRPFASSACSL